MDGEGDAIAQKDDGVDGAVATGKVQNVVIRAANFDGLLREEVLCCCWGEVEEGYLEG